LSKPRVVVTNRIFAETATFLEPHCTLELNEALEPLPPEEVRRRCADAAGLLAFMTDRVDAAFLSACPKLRVVACALKGWDNFDVEACAEAGVWLTAVPDLLTEPTAELALTLALALGRNVLAGDRLVRSGGFQGWRAELYGVGIAGTVVGIAGVGRVGRAIARRLAGFAPARMLYHDERQLTGEEKRALGLQWVTWPDLMMASDLLFLALPLTPATRHVVGAAALRQLKPGCRIVNVGRGSVVDEAALAAALGEGGEGRLAGYAADVFEFEDWALPDRPREIAPALLADARTIFTPHLGSAVVNVRREIELAAARNIVDALAGREPPDAINRPRGRAALPAQIGLARSGFPRPA
jgi:phosphonate dehydrogenase